MSSSPEPAPAFEAGVHALLRPEPPALPADAWEPPTLRFGVAAEGRNGASREDQLRADAFELGVREGEAVAMERLRPAHRALDAVTEALRASAESFERERERNLIALAMAVARRMVQRELHLDPELARTWVASALDQVPEDELAEVRLHPDTLAAFEAAPEMEPSSASRPGLRWVPDASLAPGEFAIETPRRVVDGRLDAALRALFERIDHACD